MNAMPTTTPRHQSSCTHHHRGRTGPWLALLVAGLLGGCAASSPPPVLLTLPPAVAASTRPAAAPAAMPAPALVVRRLGLPEYLVSRRVRYRADASTLAEWPNTYWAERIEIGASREFTSAVRQQLPGWVVCEATCADRPDAMTLQVDLVPMDFVRSARQLQAGARITLSGPGTRAGVLQTRTLAYELPVGSDTAQAHAQALTDLLRQVAQAVPAMVAGNPP
jgi:uncharacterized lipoprotein YmbA